MTTQPPSTHPTEFEVVQLNSLVLELEAYVKAIRNHLAFRDYKLAAIEANDAKNTAHVIFATSINLDRKIKHG